MDSSVKGSLNLGLHLQLASSFPINGFSNSNNGIILMIIIPPLDIVSFLAIILFRGAPRKNMLLDHVRDLNMSSSLYSVNIILV